MLGGDKSARVTVLLYVLGSLYQSDAAHDVVAIFDSEDFSDLFWYGDSSTCDDFSEEWNVFLVNLYGQEFVLAAECSESCDITF